MAISLQKGQKIDLTKGNPGLKHVMVGLGWDEVKKGGFLGGLLGGGQDIDCDASAILLSAPNDKLVNKGDLVYFGNLKHSSGSIKHMGDNLTGAGAGDDEQIFVDLASVPQNINKIIFVVNIYDLIVLDWGIFCHSKRLRIPGTEDMEKAYKNRWFHAKGAIIGSALGLIVALLSGCLVQFASLI